MNNLMEVLKRVHESGITFNQFFALCLLMEQDDSSSIFIDKKYKHIFYNGSCTAGEKLFNLSLVDKSKPQGVNRTVYTVNDRGKQAHYYFMTSIKGDLF